jgi:hypothetical protein
MAPGGMKRRAMARRGHADPSPLTGHLRRYTPVEPDLPPRQIMAARLLLAGRRVTDVAAYLGVNRHTIAGWLRDPEFQHEVRRMALELPLPRAGQCASSDGGGYDGGESP